MRRVIGLALIPFLALAVSACSQEISSDDLEQKVASALEEQVGEKPEKVTCEEGLEAEVGATTQCVLEHAGVKLPVDVTASSVDGGNVSIDIKVGEEPIE